MVFLSYSFFSASLVGVKKEANCISSIFCLSLRVLIKARMYNEVYVGIALHVSESTNTTTLFCIEKDYQTIIQ